MAVSAALELLRAYQDIRRLADEQLLALESDDLEAFWRLSDERESAFGVLQALEPRTQGLAPDDRLAIAGVIPAILTNDQRIQSHLDRLSDETRRDLTQLNTGMNALQSYASGGGPAAFFIDQSS